VTAKTHSVKIRIQDEEYTIRSDAPPDHTRAVAEYLDNAISRVASSSNLIETHKAAILAALQVTDELLRERAATRDLTREMLALSEDVRRLLPPAKRTSVPVAAVEE
jgi:cell division protein ZapA